MITTALLKILWMICMELCTCLVPLEGLSAFNKTGWGQNMNIQDLVDILKDKLTGCSAETPPSVCYKQPAVMSTEVKVQINRQADITIIPVLLE